MQTATCPRNRLTEETMLQGIRQQLDQCVEETSDGKSRFSFTLPARSVLDQLAQTLAHLLVTAATSGSDRSRE